MYCQLENHRIEDKKYKTCISDDDENIPESYYTGNYTKETCVNTCLQKKVCDEFLHRCMSSAMFDVLSFLLQSHVLKLPGYRVLATGS